MKRIRAWIYFISFIAALAIFSTRPQIEVYFQYLWFGGMLILSVVCVWRWLNDPLDARDVGFDLSRLPLPRSWKRWMYDEPRDSENS
jgi:hypothetical protein